MPDGEIRAFGGVGEMPDSTLAAMSETTSMSSLHTGSSVETQFDSGSIKFQCLGPNRDHFMLQKRRQTLIYTNWMRIACPTKPVSDYCCGLCLGLPGS